MGPSTRATDRAEAFLTSLAEQCRRSGTPRLPGVRALAAQAGVSVTVMWRAVARLRDQGTLTTRQGGWIAVAGPDGRAASVAAPEPSRRKWERVRDAIAREVYLGRHRPGSTLPGAKELAERYGVTYRTVRKATQALARSSVLTAYRSTFRVPFAGGDTQHNGSLVVIARGMPGAGPVPVGPRAVELLHLLENECARARVSLRFVPYDYIHGRLHPQPHGAGLSSSDAAERPLGFVVLTTGVQNPDLAWPDNLLALAPLLARHAVPIAFLDETGERLDAVTARLGSRLTIVSMSHSPSTGAAVARRLLALGHRRVAYLTAHDESVWSRNRCAGLAATMAQAGSDCGVEMFGRGDVLDAAHLRPLRDRIGELQGRLGRQCARAQSQEERLFGTVLSSQATELGDHVEREVVRQALQPLIRDAATRSDITAWVGANDQVALSCLAFLRTHHRKVPEELSVVGFDDSPEALSARLTSYNFDCAGAVQAALRHALGTPGITRGPNARVIDIEGYLVERETLGRA